MKRTRPSWHEAIRPGRLVFEPASTAAVRCETARAGVAGAALGLGLLLLGVVFKGEIAAAIQDLDPVPPRIITASWCFRSQLFCGGSGGRTSWG